jgi:hypothetical protein
VPVQVTAISDCGEEHGEQPQSDLDSPGQAPADRSSRFCAWGSREAVGIAAEAAAWLRQVVACCAGAVASRDTFRWNQLLAGGRVKASWASKTC